MRIKQDIPTFGFTVNVKHAVDNEAVEKKSRVSMSFGLGSLANAVVNNDVDVIKRLVQSMAPDEVEAKLTSMLFFASALNTTKDRTIFALVDFGANVHARDSYGRTYLHEAAAFGNAATSIVLAKVGVEVDAVSRDGSTAILEAGKFKHYDVVRALDGVHADSRIKNRYGRDAVTYVEFAMLLRR